MTSFAPTLKNSIRSPCYCGHAAADLPWLRVLLLVCSFSWSFFETLLSPPLCVCLCVCVRVCVLGSDTTAHPSPFFQLFWTRNRPGKTPACHRAAALVA